MIINNKNLLGESPIWNYLNDTFYWVDIDDYKIKSLNDFSIEEYKLEKKPTCLALIDSNQIFTVVEDGLGIYDFRTNKYNYLNKIDDTEVRFNDGKCDKNGILHIGTMCRDRPRRPIGCIYRYENKKLQELIPNIGTSNGISFDSSNNMYFSDTSKKSIFKINDKSLDLVNIYDNVGPDGSTIDNKNRYYSCLWGGSGIDIYSNDKLVNTIKLCSKNITCCCFGGNNMNRLFITSAYINDIDNGKINILKSDYLGIKEPIINFN